ncbi:uncharacterized protein LOC110032726 [Phalaenopsis equestris]|uniref:uncharacterized protein LOC110032726 n=1 Tax=Phalaenopsis equestris TaxID=78828 RepID=UPI0009E46AAC|nr:uncharacterized protein LOC110032726 [Phalaenopsis equestris]XP_020592125.1 uncharacterized protein LOC110032726 [Phalaenopsis equestris]XP_020592131.1 uncharacterized protein LOC110032726 [Phalaenopsis equestris]
MAETKGFDRFEPIFGEPTVELEQGEVFGGVYRRTFLFYAHPLDSSQLEIVVSDFHSNTFLRVLTVMDIDDLRDETGIGGSWSDFVHYLLASLSVGDVKIILDRPENLQTDCSVAHAKLITRKSKGLPRISIPLDGLLNLPAKDATANISLALFNAYKSKHVEVVKGLENLSRMKEMLSSETDRSENLQKQLDALSFTNKRKVPKAKVPEKASHIYDNIGSKELVISEAEQTSAKVTSADKSPLKDAPSLKGSQRAVPAHRRAKARGASLQNNEDDDGS